MPLGPKLVRTVSDKAEFKFIVDLFISSSINRFEIF